MQSKGEHAGTKYDSYDGAPRLGSIFGSLPAEIVHAVP